MRRATGVRYQKNFVNINNQSDFEDNFKENQLKITCGVQLASKEAILEFWLDNLPVLHADLQV